MCKCWVHHGKKRCTKLKCPLPKKIADIERFVCVMCKVDLVVSDQSINVNFDNESLELVDKLCYLGDTISAVDGAEAATIARTQCGWGKFRELRPIFNYEKAPTPLEGKSLHFVCKTMALKLGLLGWRIPIEWSIMRCKW